MNKIILFLCFISLIYVAHATVTINSEYYNSEGHIHETVAVDNAKYEDKTLVVPFSGFRGIKNSITSIGFGESTDEKFEIYYSLAMNDENIKFGLKSDNGDIKFNKKYAQSEDDSLNSVGAEFSSNGCLKEEYKNNDFEINEEVLNKNTTYTGRVAMIENKIAVSGTCSPKSGTRSFSILSKVKSQEKDTRMYAKLTENESLSQKIYFECKNDIATTGKNGSIKKLIKIETKEGYGITTNERGEIEASMTFEAYKNGNAVIPPQYVPPNGKLKLAIIPLNGTVGVKQEMYLKMNVSLWER